MLSLHRDELLAARAPSGVMAGVSVPNIAFPLSFTEATNHMTTTERRSTAKAPATGGNWWTRSPGFNAPSAVHVTGGTGNFSNGSNVSFTLAARPALWI